jgi:hypothetical protein
VILGIIGCLHSFAALSKLATFLFLKGAEGVAFNPHDFIRHHGQFSKTSISTFGGHEFCLNFLLMTREYTTQLPGRLFSPIDISKKLSHHFLLHFPIGMGSYDHHAKYQDVFMDLL